MIPHPSKADKGGEDASFTSGNILAVADGVGGWNEYGVDPAIYSRQLCKNIQVLAISNVMSFLKNPKSILRKAWEDNKHDGSSTLVVITLPKDENAIYASYVGDSGYCILRQQGPNNYQLLHESQPQQRRFNYPYQLGWGRNGDNPDVALEFKHDVRDEDLVILGTDGLFDNMRAADITNLINDHLKSNRLDEQGLATVIAEKTYRLSLDPKYQSPFGVEASKSGLLYKGGKSDDITVVVGRVQLTQSSRESGRPS
jgi:protein phosphatase PTC7